MILSHRIALDLTVKQHKYFMRAAGCDRFVWNWALEAWNTVYKSGVRPDIHKIQKQFNQIKYERYPWMHNIHKDAHSDPFRRLTGAWIKHFKNPGVIGRPRFHKKGKKDSFTVSSDRVYVKGKKLRLSVVGWVKMTESLRFIGKIKSAHAVRVADRWFISLQVDVGDYKKPRKSSKISGIDLGIKTTVTAFDGQNTEKRHMPKPLIRSLKKLRRMRRSASRRKKDGKNLHKLNNKTARLYRKITNIRNDFWQKTTTRICSENQTVGIESLNVKSMYNLRSLSRSLLDASIGMFRPMIEYKSKIYDVSIVAADRWYPSSKMCSACGIVKSVLTLNERTFHCASCGFTCDRDDNAARNLYNAACGVPPARRELTPVENRGCKTRSTKQELDCTLVRPREQ